MTAIQPAGGAIGERRDAGDVDADARHFAEIGKKLVHDNCSKPAHPRAAARTVESRHSPCQQQEPTATRAARQTHPDNASRSSGGFPALHRNLPPESGIGGAAREPPDLGHEALQLVRKYSSRLGRINHGALAREIMSMEPARRHAMLTALLNHVIRRRAPRERLRAALREASNERPFRSAKPARSAAPTPPAHQSSRVHRGEARPVPPGRQRGRHPDGIRSGEKAKPRQPTPMAGAKPGHEAGIPLPRQRPTLQKPGPAVPQPSPPPPEKRPPGPANVPLTGPSISIVPVKYGAGIQPTYNGLKTGAVAFDYFAKAGWQLNPAWLATAKIKIASDHAIRWKKNGNGAATATGNRGILTRLGSTLKKVTIDVGVASVQHQVSAGLSFEFTEFWKRPVVSPFVAQTDPATLVDKTNVKIKFSNLFAKVGVAGPFWQRATQWAVAKSNATEVELAGEIGTQVTDHAKGYLTPTWKTSGGKIEETVAPAKTAIGPARGAGVAGALALGWAGYTFSDRFVTEGWTYPTMKEGTNQFVGGVTAAYGYAGIQKLVGNAVTRLDNGAASGTLARMTPVINAARSAWTAAASTAAGRLAGAVFSKFGILGVVMPVIAAVGDVREASANFQSGQSAEGWRSLERGGVRAGAALLGTVGVVAAAGALGISLPVVAVIAAAVGIGLLGDRLARLI